MRKVVDTKGKTHSWNLVGHQVNLDDIRPRSALHRRARAILKQMYPTDNILEEVPLPGERLTFDFYLPLRKMAIEVNGEQHYFQTDHFHASRADFLKGRANDARKAEWAQLNNISLICLPYNEDDDEWKRRIESA